MLKLAGQNPLHQYVVGSYISVITRAPLEVGTLIPRFVHVFPKECLSWISFDHFPQQLI
ncbi:hypothetical protein Hanom_Chr10g00922981 [Helianthus anomalus]